METTTTNTTARIIVKDENGRIYGSYSDRLNAVIRLQKIQPFSYAHATKHEGWKVETADLIPIEKIEISRVEGPAARFTVETPAEANAILKQWRATAHHDKCDFTITFADGDTYDGTYILEPYPARPDLLKHVRDFLECYGGIVKPAHLTAQQWETHKEQQGPEAMESARRFYETYDIHARS